MNDVEHVLARPDMYIGSTSRVVRNSRCLDLDTMTMSEKQVTQSQAQEQVFKEVLANAADNVLRSRQAGVDPVCIEVRVGADFVQVTNYGLHITVGIHESSGKWLPDLLFGNLRASSNLVDTEEQRLFGGKNGIGAKAPNIFSTKFSVTCADPVNRKIYSQTWTNNMSKSTVPEIRDYDGHGYTTVIYYLDFPRFGVQGFDKEALEMYAAHCVCASYVCKLPIVFNNKQILVSEAKVLASMFFDMTDRDYIEYSDPKGMYQICIIDTPDHGMKLSFVNGIITEGGGVHVDALYKLILDTVVSGLKPPAGMKLTKRLVSSQVSVFVSCYVDKPSFRSQTKDYLASPEPNYNIPASLLSGVKKWKLRQSVSYEFERRKIDVAKKKLTGTKTKGTEGKAQPANAAGTSESAKCVYILTEGDSADSYRYKFVSNFPRGMGRQYYGSQPLQGKLPNALNKDISDLLENKELSAICHNLGLKLDVDYTLPNNFKKLNYGQVLIFPDPDNDGKHILGLVLLFFMSYFPSLVKRGYIKFLRIPTVRCTVGGKRAVFYSLDAFKRCVSSGAVVKSVEYFKGLGSSEDIHIKEDFDNPKIVTFYMDDEAMNGIKMAFQKEKVGDRKEWVSSWVNRQVLPVETYESYPITTFISHELVDYWIEDLTRSIPEALDGMKESQRKAFYAVLKKLKSKSMVKVAQAASHAAEITCYKHGETCLADTIAAMAANYVGSNNLPILLGRGQFGTRNKGGADAANARYTNISLMPWTSLMYRAEDACLEKLIEDEGESQECETFYPVLPIHVINGVRGVGTAYSTQIPPHNPHDVINWLLAKLSNHPLPELHPWYRGFIGKVCLCPDGYKLEGLITQTGEDTCEITELPIGISMTKYEAHLGAMRDEGLIAGYSSYCANDVVKYVVDGCKCPMTVKAFGLVRAYSYKNMTVLLRDSQRHIIPKKYSNIQELMEDFYTLRLDGYARRRELLIESMKSTIAKLENKLLYITSVATGKLEIRNRKRQDILSDLTRLGISHELYSKVRTDSLNTESLAKVREKLDSVINDLHTLSNTSPEEIWAKEIKELSDLV